MMKNPRNLLIFGLIGGVIGLGLGLGLAKLTGGSNFESAKAETDIRAMLDGQVAAWNSGDVSAYMDDYLQNDALRFASGGDITTGWQPTLERYQRRYPDKATMGTLITENFDVEVLDKDDALVFGSWKLIRDGDEPSGLYTLHVKHIDGRWVVISDHTSSAK